MFLNPPVMVGLQRSICWRPCGPCTERIALPSRSAGSAHDTATSDLPTLLASWRRHLTAQRMSPATLDTYSASVQGLDRSLSRRCHRSRRGSSENTSRRSQPTCSSGGSLPPRITDIAPYCRRAAASYVIHRRVSMPACRAPRGPLSGLSTRSGHPPVGHGRLDVSPIPWRPGATTVLLQLRGPSAMGIADCRRRSSRPTRVRFLQQRP